MTSSSSRLLELVRDFIARGGDVDERLDTLVLRGAMPSAAVQAEWLALSQRPPSPIESVQIYDPAITGDVSPSDSFDAERCIVVTVGKPGADGVACYFLQRQLDRYFAFGRPAPCVLVADLDPAASFETRGTRVTAWNLEAPIESSCAPSPIDPSRFVRDFVPTREVVSDLSPWMLTKQPAAPTVAFACWRRVAARRLLGSLVSSAWLENDIVWLQASGPPVFRVRADSSDVVDAFDKIDQAAAWVFLSGQDVEARHIIFSLEVARAARSGQDLRQTIEHAIEAAKSSYDAHVQSSSRETLKALADLRKIVIEETQKVSQRAQDLSASLGRDLAVTAAPFVLKVLSDAGKPASPVISAAFYFGAAAFIAVSFALQWRINAAFFDSQQKSRSSWIQTLYAYVSAKERQEIADAPIQRALSSYRETRNILGVVYAVLVAVLVTFGLVSMEPPLSAPSVNRSAAPVADPDSGPPLPREKPTPPVAPPPPREPK